MFVSIDMDKLQFMHKHPDQETLSALAFLEAPDRSVAIENTDREAFLATMTGLDLRFLYRNTTGLDITGTAMLVVREMLATLVEEKMPTCIVVQQEVFSQIQLVEEDLYKGVAWRYARGSKRPTQNLELFPFHCPPLTAEEGTAAATRAPQRRTVRTATPRPATVQTAPAGPAVPKQRGFNVRPVIWAVADRLWDEAGKPTDVKVVLELRKKMMGVLEAENGVKRTSSSNELGAWMKTRLG